MTENNPGPLKILLIEDDPDLSEGWKDVLEFLGHQVTLCLRGADALKKPELIHSCDLLVTDYYLPDLNGVELAREIRKITPSLPIIFLTGSRESAVTGRIKEMPFSLLLFKPLGIDEMEKGIQQIFAA